MAPTPISVAQGTKAAPVGYVFAGGTEITLASATARYDGAAAAGPWKPALAFYAPDGTTLLARACDTDTIAVGDDAHVTWFPRLAKAAAAAAAAGIPAATSVKYALSGAEWHATALYTDSGANVHQVVDAASILGGYVQIEADTHYFVVGAPLGPIGSVWSVSLGYQGRPDGGRIALDWQTTPIDFVRTTDFPQGVTGAEWVSSTFYRGDAGTTFDQDTYQAVASDVFTSSYAAIGIDGAAGADLSANGTAGDANYGIAYRSMGGSGAGDRMWWLRVRCNGKNGASAGFKCRVYYVAIKRMEGAYGFNVF